MLGFNPKCNKRSNNGKSLLWIKTGLGALTGGGGGLSESHYPSGSNCINLGLPATTMLAFSVRNVCMHHYPWCKRGHYCAFHFWLVNNKYMQIFQSVVFICQVAFALIPPGSYDYSDNWNKSSAPMKPIEKGFLCQNVQFHHSSGWCWFILLQYVKCSFRSLHSGLTDLPLCLGLSQVLVSV